MLFKCKGKDWAVDAMKHTCDVHLDGCPTRVSVDMLQSRYWTISTSQFRNIENKVSETQGHESQCFSGVPVVWYICTSGLLFGS